MGAPFHVRQAVSAALVQLDRGDVTAGFQGKDKTSSKNNFCSFQEYINIYKGRGADRLRGWIHYGTLEELH